MAYIVTILLCIAADQAVKFWTVANLGLFETRPLLPGLVELCYVQNTGGGGTDGGDRRRYGKVGVSPPQCHVDPDGDPGGRPGEPYRPGAAGLCGGYVPL